MLRVGRQRGIGILGLIFLLVVGGFFALTVIRLVPIYLEGWKVDRAIQAVVRDPGVGDQSVAEIQRSIIRRLDIDGVYAINERTFRDYITITKSQRQVSVHVSYDREAPLFGNLYMLARFDKFQANH